MTAALGVTFCVKVGEFQNRTTQNSGVCEGVQGPSAVFNLHLVYAGPVSSVSK